MGPAALLDYDRKRLRGLVLEEGTANSHVSIVARALGIAAVGEVPNAPGMRRSGRRRSSSTAPPARSMCARPLKSRPPMPSGSGSGRGARRNTSALRDTALRHQGRPADRRS
ncbi:MAG: PEP-utilizing enzyme [Rhodopseudomonas palustris]|nr:PEP-utilizing enzyme [Rhodopseudomonas palustris]